MELNNCSLVPVYYRNYNFRSLEVLDMISRRVGLLVGSIIQVSLALGLLCLVSGILSFIIHSVIEEGFFIFWMIIFGISVVSVLLAMLILEEY